MRVRSRGLDLVIFEPIKKKTERTNQQEELGLGLRIGLGLGFRVRG